MFSVYWLFIGIETEVKASIMKRISLSSSFKGEKKITNEFLVADFVPNRFSFFFFLLTLFSPTFYSKLPEKCRWQKKNGKLKYVCEGFGLQVRVWFKNLTYFFNISWELTYGEQNALNFNFQLQKCHIFKHFVGKDFRKQIYMWNLFA